MDKDSKKLLIMIVVIIGLFALFFFVRFVYNPEAKVLTIDDLHKKNLEGKESDLNYIYNGFSFVKMDNLWYTQVQARDSLIDIPLHFGPKELEEIPVTGKIDSFFNKQEEIYVTFDPNDTPLGYVALSSAELSLNMAKGINIMPVAACAKNETIACENRPIVDCSDEDKAVIFLKQTDSTGSVKLKGNCIELEGNKEELLKATDRLLFKWYEVMD